MLYHESTEKATTFCYFFTFVFSGSNAGCAGHIQLTAAKEQLTAGEIANF